MLIRYLVAGCYFKNPWNISDLRRCILRIINRSLGKAAFDPHAEFYIYKRYCQDKTYMWKRAWGSNAALTKIELFLPFLSNILDYWNIEFRNKMQYIFFKTSQNQIFHDELWFTTTHCVKSLKNDNINRYNELINIGIYHMVIKSTAPWVGI